jgi:HAD superfamily hydrolase (TIGR01509 family)
MTGAQGVLWDMDGVLVDTGEFHFLSWATVLADHGIPFSREFFRGTFGMNNAGILSLLLGEKLTVELLREIGDRKEEAFRRAVRGRVQPLPGVLDWLDRLRATGFRQGIASSAPQANIDALVDELGLRPWFNAVISGSELPGKPEPVLFLEVAHQLEVPPGRCIVVEDAVAGVEAAKRAGMKCVAVTTTNPAEALQAADVVVDRLDALPGNTFQRLLGGALLK